MPELAAKERGKAENALCVEFVRKPKRRKPSESPPGVKGLGDVKAAGRVLGVPDTWIYDRSRSNTFPQGVMIRLGKYIRFDLDRLLEWAKNGCPAK